VKIEGPLPGARYGATVRLSGVSEALANPEALPRALAEAGGLLCLPGLGEITDQPRKLVELSRLFGPEIEDYRYLLTGKNMVHPTVPEIFLVSNMAPVNRAPPRRPEPPLTADGKLPVQYPHRRGWHTDQSYRRPPPDISLFYAMSPVDRSRGQTIFASGTLAYEALPADLKARVETLQGLHARPFAGRGRDAALKGEAPPLAAANDRSQPQPVVRVHPVTGKKALYLCEYSQMDWFEGPFVGMPPGPNGEAAELLDRLMSHYTRPEFIYVHEWTQGDVIVWDNRCLVHTATWYDGDHEQRMMWRTTVHGNPGTLYEGEAKSWQAAAD
jgi:taurine dioxygenase